MPFTQTAVSFGAPNTTRGVPFTVSTDAAGKFIAYGCGMNAVVRPLQSAADVSGTADSLKDTVVCARHTAAVTCVRISPHGTFVASGDVTGTVIVWANRPDALEKLNFKPISGPIRDISWSEDGERIAVVGDGRSGFAGVFSASGGNTVGNLNGHTKAVNTCDFKKTRPFRIVTGGTEALAGFFEGPPFKFGHTVDGFVNSVNCVRYSNDGSLIAAVSGGKDVAILDGLTGQRVRSFPTDHVGSLWSVAWSADGSKLATCGGDKSVRVWASADGAKIGEYVLTKEQNTAAGAGGQQCGAAFLPDGTLVTVTLGGDIMFFDSAAVAKPTRVLKGHSRPVNALIAAADGSVVISAGDDGRVVRWSSALTSAAAAQFVGSQDVLLYAAAADAGASPAGAALVAVANDDLVRINTATAEVTKIAQHTGGAVAVASLQKGAVIAVLQKTSLTLYKAATGERLKQYTAADGTIGKDCRSMAASADSTLIAVGFEKQAKVFAVSAAGELSLVAAYGGVHSAAAGGDVTAVAFSACGGFVASGDSNRQLAVWEAKEGAAIVRDNMCFHASSVASLAFSPANSAVLVSGGLDGALIAWDLAGGNGGKKLVHDMAHRGGVTRVAFASADGKEVLSAGADASIKRWTFAL